VLGGTITAAAFAQIAALIEQEGLSTEWGGEPFQPADHRPDEPLSLYVLIPRVVAPSFRFDVAPLFRD